MKVLLAWLFSLGTASEVEFSFLRRSSQQNTGWTGSTSGRAVWSASGFGVTPPVLVYSVPFDWVWCRSGLLLRCCCLFSSVSWHQSGQKSKKKKKNCHHLTSSGIYWLLEAKAAEYICPQFELKRWRTERRLSSLLIDEVASNPVFQGQLPNWDALIGPVLTLNFVLSSASFDISVWVCGCRNSAWFRRFSLVCSVFPGRWKVWEWSQASGRKWEERPVYAARITVLRNECLLYLTFSVMNLSRCLQGRGFFFPS